ncbi:A-kinase anchor protein 17A [Papilio machaon]|uniref:A-kinase anchor protein 17A n=1 Tax=Papilio machaon TaxID=76193 RepID=A0A0N1PFJ0_PAPMA|nr:A-kinase anchor protein 17A [Papilio machaon]
MSIQLPSHKVYGKSISNWELMEKIRKMIQPDAFSMLKVIKHSSEVIRFDAELESSEKLGRVLSRLDNRIIQLNDYPEQLKVKVSEAKSDFPSRHTWDSFFRDATDMDEMKPGERPDTVHIANIPISWFIHEKDSYSDGVPSESLFKKVFEKFGSLRQVDVPASDPFRMQMKEAIRGITIPAMESSVYFEGYLQFSEYVGFVRCMDALRGRKLLRKKDDISEWCTIRVDFDRTKHMTDAAVKRRAIVRERLIARQRAKEEEERMEKDKIAKREAKERQKLEKSEREKLAKMREREERRKKKRLAKLIERDKVDVNKKVAEEQKKLLHAQKRLQAIRLIEELFKRIELRPELQRSGMHERYYGSEERAKRSRVVDRFKRMQEQQLENQREMVKQALDGRIVIRSALETKKPRQVSPISSLSSEDERTKRIKKEKLPTPEREYEYKPPVAGMYPYGFPYPYACAPPPGYPFPQTSMYYPVRGFVPRGRGRGRGRGGQRPRMPYFDGPDASQQYYQSSHSRSRSRKRSRSRSRRSRTKSRTKSKTKLTTTPKLNERSDVQDKQLTTPKRRSKSWSLPKEGGTHRSWSRSPKDGEGRKVVTRKNNKGRSTGLDAPITAVSLAENPWVVHLRIAYNFGDGQLKSCVGSLINERWVLTSTACVMNLRYAWIRYGAANVNNPELVTETSSSRFNNRVGLIRINSEIEFTPTISPVELATARDELPETGTLCGYGAQEDGSAGETLNCFEFTLSERRHDVFEGTSDVQTTVYDIGAPLVSNGKQIGILVTPAQSGSPASAGETLNCFEFTLSERRHDVFEGTSDVQTTVYDIGAPLVSNGKQIGILVTPAQSGSPALFASVGAYKVWVDFETGFPF